MANVRACPDVLSGALALFDLQPADAILESGDVCKDSNPAVSFRLCQLAARNGSAKAANEVAMRYLRNTQEGERLYAIALAKGDPETQYHCALRYDSGLVRVPPNKGEALRLFKLSAAQLHAEALFYVGFYYLTGEQVAKDEGVAFQLFKLSAERGSSRGQHYLNSCLADVRGVPRNPEEDRQNRLKALTVLGLVAQQA